MDAATPLNECSHPFVLCVTCYKRYLDIGTNPIESVPHPLDISLSFIRCTSYYNWSFVVVCLFRIYSVVYGRTDPILGREVRGGRGISSMDRLEKYMMCP